MLKEYESIYHQIEEKHWWHVSRRDIITKLIERLISNEKNSVLDIGCSSGQLVKQLTKQTNAKVYGIDISEDAVNKCKEQGLENIYLMNGELTTFDENMFDFIIASDCLEHLKNDHNALLDWNRILKPGGQIIIFVPAWMSLWSSLDEESSHYRRYSYLELKRKLYRANFLINRISFWNILLFVPIFIYRKIEIMFLTSNNPKQLNLPSNFFNRMIKTILFIENKVLFKLNFPIGVSLFAICRNNKT